MMKIEKSLCGIIVKYEDVRFDDNAVAEQVRERSLTDPRGHRPSAIIAMRRSGTSVMRLSGQ